VCCYDTHGIFSSPRVWWTFKVFGHKSVSVLDGGLPAWQRAGGRLETSPPREYPHTTYPVPRKDEALVRSFEQITDLVKNGDKTVQIIDARSAGRSTTSTSLLTLRFYGDEPEPRKGLFSVKLRNAYRQDYRRGISLDRFRCLFRSSSIRIQANFTT
jgi:thiosulfate/3-mercaptopyruvate sulfurtransferase